MHRTVTPLLNVGTGSDERDKTSTNVSTLIQTDPFDATGPEAMNTDDIALDVEPKSQNINSTQLSSQTFMAEMEKRFAFYKCENLTINFQPNFHKKK